MLRALIRRGLILVALLASRPGGFVCMPRAMPALATPMAAAPGAGSALLAVDIPSGHILAGSASDGTISTYDLRTGTLLHTVTLSGTLEALHSDQALGRVFAIAAVSTPPSIVPTTTLVTAIDSAAGDVVGTTLLPGTPGILLLDAHSQHIFLLGGNDNHVTMLDARTLALRHQTTVGRGPATQAAIDENASSLYVLSNADSTLSQVDTQTGSLMHSARVGHNPLSLAVDTRLSTVAVWSPQDQALDTFESAGFGHLRTLILEWPPLAHGSALLVDSAHRRFIGLGAHGQVAIIDSRTGALVATVHAGLDTAYAALDTAAGRLLVYGNGDRRLRVIDVRTGAVVATSALVGKPSQLAVNEQAHRAVVIGQGTTRLLKSMPAGQGVVEILDSLTGRHMGRIRVGAMPDMLAADLGQGRALVQSETAGRVMASVIDLRTGRMLSTFALGMHA